MGKQIDLDRKFPQNVTCNYLKRYLSLNDNPFQINSKI